MHNVIDEIMGKVLSHLSIDLSKENEELKRRVGS